MAAQGGHGTGHCLQAARPPGQNERTGNPQRRSVAADAAPDAPGSRGTRALLSTPRASDKISKREGAPQVTDGTGFLSIFGWKVGQGRPFGYDFPAKEVAKAAGEVTLERPPPVGRREERSVPTVLSPTRTETSRCCCCCGYGAGRHPRAPRSVGPAPRADQTRRH